MKNKLPHSRLTSISGPLHDEKIKNKRIDNILTSKKDLAMPYKYGKQRIRKQTTINIHSQTTQNPQRIGIHTFTKANRSQVFQDQIKNITQSAIINKRSGFIFDNSNYIPISKAGQYSHLKYQSHGDFQLFRQQGKNTGVSKNNNKKQSYAMNPITQGQAQEKRNGTLTNMWKQDRRKRDNGSNCADTLKWDSKLNKRFPYEASQLKKVSSSRQFQISSIKFH